MDMHDEMASMHAELKMAMVIAEAKCMAVYLDCMQSGRSHTQVDLDKIDEIKAEYDEKAKKVFDKYK